jgi:hypothetical protein
VPGPGGGGSGPSRIGGPAPPPPSRANPQRPAASAVHHAGRRFPSHRVPQIPICPKRLPAPIGRTPTSERMKAHRAGAERRSTHAAGPGGWVNGDAGSSRTSSRGPGGTSSGAGSDCSLPRFHQHPPRRAHRQEVLRRCQRLVGSLMARLESGASRRTRNGDQGASDDGGQGPQASEPPSGCQGPALLLVMAPCPSRWLVTTIL